MVVCLYSGDMRKFGGDDWKSGSFFFGAWKDIYCVKGVRVTYW